MDFKMAATKTGSAFEFSFFVGLVVVEKPCQTSHGVVVVTVLIPTTLFKFFELVNVFYNRYYVFDIKPAGKLILTDVLFKFVIRTNEKYGELLKQREFLQINGFGFIICMIDNLPCFQSVGTHQHDRANSVVPIEQLHRKEQMPFGRCKKRISHHKPSYSFCQTQQSLILF